MFCDFSKICIIRRIPMYDILYANCRFNYLDRETEKADVSVEQILPGIISGGVPQVAYPTAIFAASFQRYGGRGSSRRQIMFIGRLS